MVEHISVVLRFYVPPTAKVEIETGPRIKVAFKRLEMPGVEPRTSSLQGE